jgi:hypothetical protein
MALLLAGDCSGRRMAGQPVRNKPKAVGIFLLELCSRPRQEPSRPLDPAMSGEIALDG